MEAFLPKEVQAGLETARVKALQKSSRLRIDVDGVYFRVLRMWKTGFAMDLETAPNVRGLVDLYDGGKHLFQCLIVANEEDGQEMLFEFKRATPVVDAAALDFEKAEDAPVGLLTRD